MAISRLDIEPAVDRLMFVAGYGHFMGFPSRPGESSTATTGVPINGIAGFAPGAMFHNYKGTVGSSLYVNVGSNGYVNGATTNAGATWLNIG